jgi:alpha-2-macroglobulin
MNGPMKSLSASFLVATILLAAVVTAQAQAPKAGDAKAASKGPSAIVEAYPKDETNNISEWQEFALRFAKPIDTKSLRGEAMCNIKDTGNLVGVTLLSGDARTKLLAQAKMPDTPEVLTLRCITRVPFKSNVTIEFSDKVKDRNGASINASSVGYTVLGDTGYRVMCERSNARAECIGFRPITVRFDSPIDLKQRDNIVLKAQDGKVYKPAPITPDDYDTETDVTFKTLLPESTRFELVLPASMRDRHGRAVGVTTGNDRIPYFVRTGEYPPLVKFSGRFGLIEREANNPSAAGLLPLTVRNVDAPAANTAATTSTQLRTLHVTTEADIIKWVAKINGRGESSGDSAGGLGDEDDGGQSVGEGEQKKDSRSLSVLEKEKASTVSTLPKQLQAKEFEVIGVPLAKPGFHVVEVKSAKLGNSLLPERTPMYVRTSALVTNLAAHLKIGTNGSLVWVTQLSTGKPVAKARVSVRDCQGKSLWVGDADNNGVAMIRAALPAPNYECPTFAFASSGDDLTFVQSNWQQGIERWRFNFRESDGDNPGGFVLHTVFDRTLFKPGETVSMKVLAREDSATGLKLPNLAVLNKTYNKAVLVHVGSGDQVEQSLTWQKNGSSTAEWKIPKGVKQGLWEVMVSGQQTGSIRIGEFKIPLSKGEIEFGKFNPVMPKEVPVMLALNYLAGGPLMNAPVKVRARVVPRAFDPEGFEQFEFADLANLRKLGKGNWQTLMDGDDGTWAGGWRSRSRYVRGETIELPTQDITLNDKGTARVLLKGLEKISGVQSLVSEMEFADPNGEIQTVSARTPVAASGVIIGTRAKDWIGRAGSPMTIEVAAVDVEGKPRSGVAIDVVTKLKITLSHRARAAGGFYTYQNRDEIRPLKAQCGGRTDNRGIVECTVTPDAAGNIIFAARAKDSAGNAVLASRDVWIVGKDAWWFEQEDHDRMDVVADKRQYNVGDTATLQVRMPFQKATALVAYERSGVMDYAVTELAQNASVVQVPIRDTFAPNVFVSVLAVRGRTDAPAPTAMIDLAKPAFKLGIVNLKVGSQRHQLKVQVTTDKASYQVRDKVKVKVRVTRPDGKPLGEGAEVALAGVDEGLLELMPNKSWDVLTGMMRERGYGVETSSAQMHVVGRRHFGKKALPAGGGGGKSPTREVFDPLLKWQARLVLNANGEAETEVPLNDSLTRFRIAAVATAGDSFFGDGSAAVTANKDLQMFSGVPMVTREGDQYRARLTVRNASPRVMSVSVNATMTERIAGAAAKAANLPEQKLSLKAGESAEVLWDAAVSKDATGAEWLFKGQEQGGTGNDALKITQTVITSVPVVSYEQNITEITEPSKPFFQNVNLPATALAGRGELKVLFQPTMIPDVEGIRAYMRSYPFWCLEQRTSKSVALRDARLWGVIADSIDTYLDADGLADYFPGSTAFSSRTGWPSLTSYVLSASQDAGFEVPTAARDRMLSGLDSYVSGRLNRTRSYIKDPQYVQLQKLAALEALARYGKVKQSHLDALKLDIPSLPTSGLISLLNATSSTAKGNEMRDQQRLAAQTTAELRKRIKLDGSSHPWAEDKASANRWWMMADGSTNTVRLLLAATKSAEWRNDVPQIAKSAQASKERGHYWMTTTNVWATIAFEAVAKASGSGNTTGVTAVVLGSTTKVFDWAKNPNGGEMSVAWPTDAAGKTLPLAIAHEGKGKPFVTVTQTAAVPVTTMVNRGFDLKKTITPVQQKVAGQWSRGDIMKVRLEFKAKDQNGWVVIDDPIPPGATILGSGLARDSAILNTNNNDNYWTRPLYIERTFDSYRAYYEHVWPSITFVEYNVRLNTEGTFEMPRTHIEAMYSPTNYTDIPNAKLVVK